MSDSSVRGKAFEILVQKLTRQKLHMDIKRDSRSGAGLHKQDVRDRYNLLPIFIECKDHETIKPKAWWREADAKASFGQAPVVVFPDDSEVLCVMRYSDLLNFIKEAADWKETAEDYRTSGQEVHKLTVDEMPAMTHTYANGKPIPKEKLDAVGIQVDPNNPAAVVGKISTPVIQGGAKTCRNGHIADEHGYCMQKDCQYRRGYVKKKVKK